LALYAISSCPINSLAAAVVLASTNGSTCDPHHPSPAPSSLPPIRARRGGAARHGGAARCGGGAAGARGGGGGAGGRGGRGAGGGGGGGRGAGGGADTSIRPYGVA
jgi:hypothetical protein